MKKGPKTSWGNVAGWYDTLLEDTGTYQADVILPNLLRILSPRKGLAILDLACGQGFFARAFAERGASVIGIDISKELIARAEKHPSKNIAYHVAPADAIPFVRAQSIDHVMIVLAIQNIERVDRVFAECSRVLKPHGTITLVLNHPAFRIPKGSSWGWDPSTSLGTGPKGLQYRRIDNYLSESKIKIQMHPGSSPSDHTLSFHRPLQYYFKLLAKHGFAVNRLEEWISNKKSQPGPRAKAEDRARHEIPLFLFLEARRS